MSAVNVEMAGRLGKAENEYWGNLMCSRDQSPRDRDAAASALLKELLARELAAHDPLLPPWLRFPDIDRGSVNWNMGQGEDYISIWEHWINRISREQVLAYYERFAPIPHEWVDWVAFRLYDDYDGRQDAVYARRLADLHLVDFEGWMDWHRRMLRDWQT